MRLRFSISPISINLYLENLKYLSSRTGKIFGVAKSRYEFGCINVALLHLYKDFHCNAQCFHTAISNARFFSTNDCRGILNGRTKAKLIPKRVIRAFIFT